MAGQLKAAGKVMLFQGFKEMLIPYLDIAPLMPPERLRWSRILKRPLLEQSSDEALICPIWPEEIRPYPQCDVRWYCKDGDIIEVASGTASEMPEDAFWVYIRGDGDEEFAAAWLLKHGHDWPFVADRQPHPALSKLRRRYMRFWGDWSDHGESIVDEHYENYDLPVTTFVMGSHVAAQG